MGRYCWGVNRIQLKVHEADAKKAIALLQFLEEPT
tara:strand:- start:3831 stop:3935 length:105 start_codon:yes stop_codon:yes gene_type:complete